jgi:hypothetical protein
MHGMQKNLAAALLVPLVAAAGGLAGAQTPTPPPEIIHVYSRPLCSALRSTIAPAIGMMLQNDKTIGKSPPLFQDYIRGATESDPNSDGASPAQDLAVMRLENLVSPLADNVLAIQKQLEDKSVFPDAPSTDDEKRLAQLKAQMLQALATQQAALDIINGFVDTQQLGEMQHEGFGYISAINGPSVASTANPQQFSIMPTQNPDAPQLFDNLALNAGLSPNPYEMDLSRVPGLAVGYNPVKRLKDGVEWTQKQGQERENTLAANVMNAVQSCKSDQPPSPRP